MQTNSSEISILGETSQVSSDINISQYLDPGHYTIDYEGAEYLLTTSYFVKDT